MGEFGRTPRINTNGGGRDHWNFCYSLMLAGGGIKAGYIHGASDRIGARPSLNPVTPADIIATIYHALGIPADLERPPRPDAVARAVGDCDLLICRDSQPRAGAGGSPVPVSPTEFRAVRRTVTASATAPTPTPAACARPARLLLQCRCRHSAAPVAATAPVAVADRAPPQLPVPSPRRCRHRAVPPEADLGRAPLPLPLQPRRAPPGR